MSFIPGTLRLMLLTNELNTTQAELTELAQTKSSLATEVGKLTAQISELDADDATLKQLNAKKAQFEAMEKRIDADIKLKETKISKAQAELQSVEQMVAQGIQRSTPKYCGVSAQ